MAETLKSWPEFSQLDLLLAREGMARSPEVWSQIHTLLLSRIAANQDLSSPAALSRLLGPLVCKSPVQQQRIEGVIEEWFNGQTSQKTSIQTTASRTETQSSRTTLKRFKLRFILLASALILLLSYLFYQKLLEQSEVVSPPNPAVTTPIIDPIKIEPIKPQVQIPIIDSVEPNRLPLPLNVEHEQLIYWTLVTGLPSLGFVLWLLWQYWPQIILRKQKQDDDPSILGLRIKDFEYNPDIPFGGAKTSSELDPLLRPLWIDTRRLHVADSVLATANNYGFFTPVYQQRIQRPEYLVLVQSRHGYDLMADLAELFIQTLRQKSKHIHVRGYRFRDDPRLLSPIALPQPEDDDDKTTRSLFELAKNQNNARLIIISDWDIAFLPFQPESPQAWSKDLQKFQKKIWLCPGPDTQDWAERAKSQSQQLNIRLLPLSSSNLQEIARWLSQSHNPLPPPGHAGNDPLPTILSETAESWLSWRPPHGSDVKQLIQALRDYLGKEGFLLLQALAVFPKPVWPLPYILDSQLFASVPSQSRHAWLPWRRKKITTTAQQRTPLAKEQRLIKLGRLPWSRYAYMPDYLRERLLKALTRKERRLVSQGWKALMDRLVINQTAEKIDIPIKAGAKNKVSLQRLLLSQEQGTALDDAIFANILLGGSLGLLDFKLPQLLAKWLPGAAKVLDLRPALLGLMLAVLTGSGLAYGWEHGVHAKILLYQITQTIVENNRWHVRITAKPDLMPLANVLQQSLTAVDFPVDPIVTKADSTINSQNQINYASGGLNSARRIQQRLRWVTYDADVAIQPKSDLPAHTIEISLNQGYRHGSAFNDRLEQAYKKPEQPPESVMTFHEPDMVIIPAGKFLMGSPDKEPGRYSDEDLQHEVTFAHPFAIGKTEVTFDEYAAFAQATGRTLPDDSKWGRGDRPVINVSFNDAQSYAHWLSQQTGKNYRLPTEAEWEYAARAGTTTAYWWGDSTGKNHANCRVCGSPWDAKNQTAPVAYFKPNAFGLYDTAGNVWEWVQDCYHSDYQNAPDDGSAWLQGKKGDCGRRVVRGGSWFSSPRILRSANRGRNFADDSGNDLGFRIARAL